MLIINAGLGVIECRLRARILIISNKQTYDEGFVIFRL